MGEFVSTRILITGALCQQAIDELSNCRDYIVVYRPDCEREDLLNDLIEDAQVLVTRSETTVDKVLLDKARHLKLIARAAVGVGNIDLDYATEKGVLVVNTPGKNTNSAAELTFGLLLAMMRNIPQAHFHLKNGGWDRHNFNGIELKDKKIGIVGLGNVGHRVAKFAHGFDMEVYGYDPYIASQLFARYQVKRCSTLDEMLEKVDILTVHVPLNRETKGMIGQKELSKLSRGSFVVNAARGGIICEQALCKALNDGQLNGAAIDTWENEPKPIPELINHPKVWVSPHIGASTEEAQRAIGASIVEQIHKALSGGVVDHPVNLPQIGVIDNPLVRPYTVLAEKLGSLAAQLIKFSPIEVEISFRGDLAGIEPGLIKLGLQKGFAARAVDSYVSYVNAAAHFEKLGLICRETHDPEFQSYRSALKTTFRGDKGEELILGGIVFDQRYIRISLLDHFYFEVEPTGRFLLVRNNDKPGVIGDVGHMLAGEQINIDSFDLSRKKQGGQALALIKVDQAISSELCLRIASLPNVISAEAIEL